MNIAEIREYLDRHASLQPGTKIQYGHPSPRFWSPATLDLAEVARLRRPDRKLFLYLHIPFCPQTDPPACGFCLFAREDFAGYPAVENYLEYLRRELAMYAQIFGGEELACVYFGGGTPNILKPRDYLHLMAWVRESFRLAPNVEVTLEGVPQLFDGERLTAMATSGVTRVSIGAQQLNDDLLRHSGRKHHVGQVLAAIDMAHQLGMAVNVDLICGWFDQRERDLENDLAILVPHAPESIVVHPLTLAGSSHFADQQHKLPSNEATCSTFLRGRRYLEAHGYWPSSYVDYMLANPRRGPEEVKYLRLYRDFLRYDRLGVGYGANSLFAGTLENPGVTWRNVDQTKAYYQHLDAGCLPINYNFAFNDVDLRLLYVLKGLEGTPYLNAGDYARDLGGNLAWDFADYWTVLQEKGWLEIDDSARYRIVGDGVFFLPMVQRCISNDRNNELRGALAVLSHKTESVSRM
jgi:oxygen-independent coproporphyrinogen-3 oxidase